MREKGRGRTLLHHLVALAVALLFLLPLLWVTVASLRQPGLPPPPSVEWWPTDPQWNNYRLLFEIVPMGRYLWNSIFINAIAVPTTLLSASLAAFAISQVAETARRRLLLGTIALLIVPSVALWMFRFHLLRWFGLLDTPWALILPSFAGSNPLFVLLFYWSFRHIPAELFDAARLDGAGAWTIWRRVAMPLVAPTTAAVTVLTFVAYWNDFVGPVLYLFDPQNYTLPVGLQILNQLDATNWPLLMAASVLITAPVLLLFLLLQRYFMHDLAPATLFDRN